MSEESESIDIGHGAPLSVDQAVASVRGHEAPVREVGVSDAYDNGDVGIRQAAEDLGRKRRQREEQQQVSAEFAAEIERAWPQAQAKLKAQADEIEFAEAFEQGQKLREKGDTEGWSVDEAAKVHAAKREYARALAEQDLAQAILANREEDAQQASRDQRRLENEQRERLRQPGDAQQRLSRHAQANKLAQADAHASTALSQIALAHHRLVAHAKTQFPEMVGKSADEQAAIVARMPPGRQRQFVTMDAQARQLEGAANAWHAERGKYNRISSGIAQQEAQQAAQARFNHWAQQQDAAIAQAVPELSGERAEEFQKACIATLRDAGLNDAQIASAWHQPQLRSVAGQKLLAQAARQRLARESLEHAKVTRPTPRVMRPGNGHRNSDAGERSLADLSAKLSATGKLKDAVALRAAKRRAAARSH